MTQRFTVPVPLDPLPLGRVVTGVTVQPTGLAIRTAGDGVRLGA